MRRLAAMGLVVLALAAVGRGALDDNDPSIEGKPLSAWVAQLKDPDAHTRDRAAHAIGLGGAAAKAAVPSLIPLLNDPDVNMVNTTANALAAIGPDAVEPLKQALKDKEANVRARAAFALGNIGEKASNAGDALADMLANDEDPGVRACAAYALASFGPDAKSAVPALAAATKDKDPDVRKEAIYALAEHGADAMPALTALLKSGEPDFGKAIRYPFRFREFPIQSDRLVELLLGALNDKDAVVRAAASRCLEDAGPFRRNVRKALISLLKHDQEAAVRAAAVRSMGAARSISLAQWETWDSPEAIDALTAAVKDKDAEVRAAVIDSLGGHGVVMPLLTALKDDDASVRKLALEGLPHSQPPAQAVPLLVDALKNPDAEVRFAAAICLSRAGENGKPAVGQLAAHLKDADFQRAVSAAKALGELGPNAAEAVEPLIAVVKDENSEIRGDALNALGRIGEPARAALPTLTAALNDKILFNQAPDALAGLGKIGLPALKEALKSDDANLRFAVVEASPRLGADALELLALALKDKDARVRDTAVITIRICAMKAEDAIKALTELGYAVPDRVQPQRLKAEGAIKMLTGVLKDDGDSDVRARAAWELSSYAAGANEADMIQPLTAALKDDDPRVRAAAAGALQGCSAHAKQVLPLLLNALNDRFADVQASAAAALGSFGEAGKPAVGPLIERLKDQEFGPDASTVNALANLGPHAREAVPALITLVRSDNHGLRNEAALALAAIGGEEAQAAALPVLKELLKLHREGVAERVLPALEKLGKIGLPELKEALLSENPNRWPAVVAALSSCRGEVAFLLAGELTHPVYEVRKAAADALGQMGADAKPAIGPLTDLLRGPDDSCRTVAGNLLGSIGVDAVPALTAALKDDDEDVRVAAAGGLFQMGRNATGAVGALAGALKDQCPTVRASAAQALGAIGPDAKSAVEALRAAAKDEDPTTAQAAADALKAIEAKTPADR